MPQTSPGFEGGVLGRVLLAPFKVALALMLGLAGLLATLNKPQILRLILP
jgi:hypothetical protein